MISLQSAPEEELAAKVDRLTQQLAQLTESQRRRDELFDELTPILKLVLGVATEKLSLLEHKGYFAFGKSLMDVADNIITGYSPDDVRALADSIVTILDTVRALTQPHALQVMREAGEVVERSDTMEPLGVVAMLKASRDEGVQRGMAVMLEVLRHVGKGAQRADRRERLRSQLAARPAPGAAVRVSASSTRSGASSSPPPTAASSRHVGKAPPPPTTSSGSPQPAASSDAHLSELLGAQLTAEGFLSDPTQWNRELALAIARSIGVELSERHWLLFEAARKDFEQTGASPNIRRLTKISAIDTKELYAMFPKAPGKCCAMIAGLPKPVGCI